MTVFEQAYSWGKTEAKDLETRGWHSIWGKSGLRGFATTKLTSDVYSVVFQDLVKVVVRSCAWRLSINRG